MIWKQIEHHAKNAQQREHGSAKNTPSAENWSEVEDESSEASSHGLPGYISTDLMESIPSENPNRVPSDRVLGLQGTALGSDPSRSTTLGNQNEEDGRGRSSLAQVR